MWESFIDEWCDDKSVCAYIKIGGVNEQFKKVFDRFLKVVVVIVFHATVVP